MARLADSMGAANAVKKRVKKMTRVVMGDIVVRTGVSKSDVWGVCWW